MSSSTAALSLCDFCKHFSANLYDAWVHLPKGEDLAEVEKNFRERGFPGAVGSIGCTRVARARCPPRDAPAYTGKEGFPSWKYGVTVDLDGRILASTKGSPGGVSEKAVVRSDVSVLRVRDESPWATLPFLLCEEDGKEVEHVGGWLVANGDCDLVSEPCATVGGRTFGPPTFLIDKSERSSLSEEIGTMCPTYLQLHSRFTFLIRFTLSRSQWGLVTG